MKRQEGRVSDAETVIEAGRDSSAWSMQQCIGVDLARMTWNMAQHYLNAS